MKNKWLSVLFKKIAAFFISIWVLSAIVFFLSRITPIDPLQSYYGERVEKMSEEQKDSARERLGLMIRFRYNMCAGLSWRCPVIWNLLQI